MRSAEPLLSTHPLTEPRKGDRFYVVLQWKEMPMDIEHVLFCDVRKSRKMIDVGCVAPE